ncbi:CBF1/Su(H)/LAG-1 family transcription factor Cbf12 [Schizosaccharomyces japonicus yFS275]|uniref:CBF1/Su(H)/LAG-1 family transcription factor Cbf12 n=1 Tax=Schizosaccharomyces japonicus (strain yFS275 / FY16936) TaxID=402676 RepID=B6K4C8_SCHJY|nr:CBF1/Su(H)/LAG-1 family transcription factor Cbf12 [Schizosaccharomyces japonicus yFS275]EEB08335.2 CBF1/Su(H)/LAG-1 family transcription factor Cbf12 [Schizosaccharomyces japonicus yFS275]
MSGLKNHSPYGIAPNTVNSETQNVARPQDENSNWNMEVAYDRLETRSPLIARLNTVCPPTYMNPQAPCSTYDDSNITEQQRYSSGFVASSADPSLYPSQIPRVGYYVDSADPSPYADDTGIRTPGNEAKLGMASELPQMGMNNDANSVLRQQQQQQQSHQQQLQALTNQSAFNHMGWDVAGHFLPGDSGRFPAVTDAFSSQFVPLQHPQHDTNPYHGLPNAGAYPEVYPADPTSSYSGPFTDQQGNFGSSFGDVVPGGNPTSSNSPAVLELSGHSPTHLYGAGDAPRLQQLHQQPRQQFHVSDYGQFHVPAGTNNPNANNGFRVPFGGSSPGPELSQTSFYDGPEFPAPAESSHASLLRPSTSHSDSMGLNAPDRNNLFQRVKNVLRHPELLCAMKVFMPSLGQKSYGKERRYICPPAVVYLLGSSWFRCPLDKINIIANAADDPDNLKTSETPTFYTSSSDSATNLLSLGQVKLDDPLEQQQSPSPIWANTVLKTLYYSGKGDHNTYGRSTTLQVHVRTPQKRITMDKLRIGIISKPSQKKMMMKVSDLNICHGDCVSLFNRFRSHNNLPRYLCTNVLNDVVTKRTEHLQFHEEFTPATDLDLMEASTCRLITTNTVWEPFNIYSVEELENKSSYDRRNTVICSNMRIIIQSQITGVRSPPLIIRKYENRKALVVEDDQLGDSINCLSRLAFQCPRTKLFLNLDEFSNGEIRFLSADPAPGEGDGNGEYVNLPWSAVWSIITTQSVRTMFFDDCSGNDGMLSIPSAPIIKFIRMDESNMLHVYGVNFTADAQVWIGENPCQTYSVTDVEIDEPTLLRGLISTSHVPPRLHAYLADLADIICQPPALSVTTSPELPILVSQQNIIFHSGFTWPIHPHTL